MIDFVKINGAAVRPSSIRRQKTTHPEAGTVEEIDLAVILRGTMADRQFRQVMTREPLRLEIPNGTAYEVLEVTIADVYHSSSGSGEAAAHRYDLKLRETPASAERRAADAPAPSSPSPAPKPAKPPAPEPEDDSDPDAPLDLSQVQIGTSDAAWATAIRRLKTPPAAKPSGPPEPPLTAAELAGVEAVLVGLRQEALLEALEAAGLIRRSAVDDRFLRLIGERFVAEATPIVGEAAARRAAKGLVDG